MKIQLRSLFLSAALLAVGLAFIAVQCGPEVAALGFLGLNALVYSATVSTSLGAVNALGTLDASQLVLQRALRICFTIFPQLGLIAKGFKDMDGRIEAMSLGQTAIARKLSLSTVGNFGDASSAFNMTDVPVTLSNFPQISHSFTVDEINKSQQGFNLMDQVALPMAIKLAQAITSRVTSLVSAGNFNNTVNGIAPTLTVAAGWTRANTILTMQTACNERGIPQNIAVPTVAGDAGMLDSNRFFVLNSTVNAALLADQMIVSEFNNTSNAMAIKMGKLPAVSGFDFAVYPQMPNTDGNLLGFAGSADALAYVARAPRTPWDLMPDLPKTALMRVVTDPTTGFQILLLIDGDIGTFGIRVRMVWLDGLAVGNGDNLIRLVNGVIGGAAGTITGGVVTNAGYGYKNAAGVPTAPTVTITPAAGDVTGNGATATATISANGAVTGIVITAPGTLYTKPPVVTITPVANGSATGPATAIGVVGGLT